MSRKTFVGALHLHWGMLAPGVVISILPATTTTFAKSCAPEPAAIASQLNGRHRVMSAR